MQWYICAAGREPRATAQNVTAAQRGSEKQIVSRMRAETRVQENVHLVGHSGSLFARMQALCGSSVVRTRARARRHVLLVRARAHSRLAAGALAAGGTRGWRSARNARCCSFGAAQINNFLCFYNENEVFCMPTLN